MIARPGGAAVLAEVGAGLRGPHVPRILDEKPAVSWFELLTDNHLAEGGALRFQAEAIAERYPVTLHGVGMSLGGADALDTDYLRKVKGLADRTGAALVSEHLAFTCHAGWHVHELLPIPWTEECLRHVSERVRVAQDRLGRQILIENISAYFEFESSSLSETQFLEALCEETGCGMLLDVNNIFVNAANHGFDALDYLRHVPWRHVGEIHLAGHSRKGDLLVDTHAGPVSQEVLELYLQTQVYAADVPVLIEWDNDLPEWPVLLREVRQIEALRVSAARKIA
jgi:uncharacterized protein (UPF0276 family)